MDDALHTLETYLHDYRMRWPNEGATAKQFLSFLKSHQDVFLRNHEIGHFTGSALLVSSDGQRTLLMHHRKLDRWLQPGGHADGNVDLRAVSLREASEESGLKHLYIEGDILDLDRHRIPERDNEPAHWHYDVRHVVRCQGDETFVVNEEAHALAWRPLSEVATDPRLDPSLRRMARKCITGMF